nr:ribonuclease H-like domain-containing protein [Tanacetum cinerariifolium]
AMPELHNKMELLKEKNRTLIEAARTMLADSLLSTIFWTKAVATACYVLNKVLVTKPYDRTPYELLTGDKPSISYLKPFGCHVTILNTSDPLGKFDKKLDEGYIVRYSISSKDYRVYNLVSRKIEETINLKFIENKPFVAGTGQAWMFDIDYLTDSLNYSRVSSTNLIAGSQGATPSNAVVPIVDEATTQNDCIQSDHVKTNADNMNELAELQALQRQEQAGKEEADRLRLAFSSLNLILGVGTASIGSFIYAGSTPPVSAGSTPLMSPCASSISADRHSIFAGKCHVSAGRPTGSAGRLVSAGRPSGSTARTPIFDCPKFGIFTSSSYDEEFAGLDANNLERSLDVRSTITKRIHNIHPTSQVLGVINSPVQTRRQVKHTGSSESDFISYIYDQRRNNHTDFQLCMFSCFLSQEEPTTVAQALANPDWAIGTKWILKNKRDAKGIVFRNKARLVAQGDRQEEGIDYTDIFAPVARIEAIRLFLAFALFMGFMVYQMDVKSAFLYEKIAEEVYVTQPRDNSKLASTPFEPQKIREKNVHDKPISVHLYRSMIGCLMYLTVTRPDIMFVVCAAARHQVTPKTSNLLSVKRIFNDYAGANGDMKSTTGGCQFLGRRLISWQCKKQTIVATSSYEAKYVAAASCYGQWFLFTSAGHVTFCWLFPILAVTYVSAGFSVSAASSIPAATPITAGISTTAGAFGSASEASVPIIELLDSPPKDTSLPLDPKTEEQDEPLRESSRKKSIAIKRTLPSPSKPKFDALPFDEDDPEAAFKRYLRQASNDDEPVEHVSLALVSDITTWEIIPIEFRLGEMHVITRADGTVKRTDASIIWDDQDQWQIRSWRFYAIPAIHVLETEAGDIMYMFVDKKYPLTPMTLQQMLNHGLEIDRDPSGNDLTTAIQLIQSFLNQLNPAA